MPTLLARKANSETPVATNDDHHEALASDPNISSFPQGSTFGSVTTQSTSTTTFGGFGNASASTPSGSSAFGSASTGGFGSTSSLGSSSSAPAGPTPNLTQAGSNAAQGADVLVANDNSDWINKKWRPVMGWVYMLTCTADFVIFPVLWSLLQALSKGQVTNQWQPLTLQGAGLYHIAMGAVLGIAAYGRTKEKIAEKA